MYLILLYINMLFVYQVKKPNPRELNPYYKDDGTGFPEDEVQTKVGGSQLLSSSVVGDGGASWRLKALKRAQEQAARDGRQLKEVHYLNFSNYKQFQFLGI